MDTLYFERFRELRCIGHGGTARVLLTEDTLLKKTTVLKFLHEHLRDEPLILERFRQEARISRALQGTGIVRVFDLYEDDYFTALAMEYLEGGNLKQRIIENGKIAWNDFQPILIQLLETLHEAHRKGYVHKDIKPQNLLFSSQGTVKFSDFGLAQATSLDGILYGTQVEGTLEYAAPELIRGDFCDFRSDLYSLGVTVFEALTGELPFSGNSPYEIIHKQLEEAPPLLNEYGNFPQWLEDIVLKALQKDASLRFQTAEEFLGVVNEKKLPAFNSLDIGSYTCPVCQKKIHEDLNFCKDCGFSANMLVEAAQGRDRCAILITKQGAEGEKLRNEERLLLLSLLKRINADASSIEKKAPRLPFVLVKRISIESANTLAKMLVLHGFDAQVVSKENKQQRSMYNKALNKKVLTMIPRFYAIIGSMGFYVHLWRLTSFFAIIAGFFALVPVLSFFWYRRPLSKIDKNVSSERLLLPFMQLASSIDNKGLTELLQQCARKIQTLNRSLSSSSKNSQQKKSGEHEYVQTLENLAKNLGSLIQSAAELEKSNLKKEEQKLALQIRQKQQGGETTAEEDKILKEIMIERKKAEQALNQILDFLNHINVKLDKLTLQLSGTQSSYGKLERCSVELDQLQASLDAFAIGKEV